jgi:hypothetical protein
LARQWTFSVALQNYCRSLALAAGVDFQGLEIRAKNQES